MLTSHEQASRAVALWDIQESLLQSYRALFVTAESIVFGLAATIMTSQPRSCLVLGLLGLSILWIWHEVCKNRATDVTFAQWLAVHAEEGIETPAPVTALKSFQDNEVITVGGRRVWRRGPSIRETGGVKIERDERYDRMLQSKSRRRMEFQLPALFLGLWIVVSFFAILSIIPHAS